MPLQESNNENKAEASDKMMQKMVLATLQLRQQR